MLVSSMVLGLYFWVFFSGATTVSTVLLVHDYAAIAAGVVFTFALISHLWSPRKHLFGTALTSYALLLAMTVILITNTGQVSSPFVALWMIAAIFSPAFSWYGIGLIASMAVSFIGYTYSLNGFDLSTILTVIFISILPIIVGLLGFRPTEKTTTTEDREYHEIASELSQAANMAEIVISAIADGVVATDKEGIIQLINPAAQKLIGWDHKDAIGLSIASVINLVDERYQPVSDLNNPVQQALRTGIPAKSDRYSLLTADAGKKILASVTASPLGDESSGIIVVFRDITKERAEEREQAEFISTASHEMRTPVASIEGYLGLALNPNTAQIDIRARDYIMKAHDSAQHLGRLFQDLLDVSKADDGRLKNDPYVIDVVPFFRDIIVGFTPKAAEKQLTIHYKPMPSLDLSDNDARGERTVPQILYVHVDRDHLREVLSNLTENAIKYTPSGSVNIDVSGTNQHVTISISDTGIGIPKEDIGHLFQKFYRVDNSATREIGGTGLGLYLCRKLTEAMGGKIWVESTYQQGSTFYIRLPRLEQSKAESILMEQGRLEAKAREEQEAQTRTIINVSYEAGQAAANATQSSIAQAPVISQPEPISTPAAASNPPVTQPGDPARPPLEALIPQPTNTVTDTSGTNPASLAQIESNHSAYAHTDINAQP